MTAQSSPCDTECRRPSRCSRSRFDVAVIGDVVRLNEMAQRGRFQRVASSARWGKMVIDRFA
jgi:hypothetical protein